MVTAQFRRKALEPPSPILLLALKDFLDRDFENILKRPAFCQQKHHEKEELKFFCTDCKIAICSSCVATIHEGHAKMVLEEAANERKSELKSAIEYQKQGAQKEMAQIAKLDENCAKVQEQAAEVKSGVQQFVDGIIAVMEAKRVEIFDRVGDKVKEYLERLEMQRDEIEQQLKMRETAIEKSEILMKRSTSAQIMQPNELLDKSSQRQGYQQQTVDRNDISFPVFHFVKNEELFDYVSVERLGCLNCFLTNSVPHQASAEGKGIREATVGLEAQIVVTTRNAQGEQYYDERDCVTVEITNRQGHDCATKAQVQDNKDGSYKISYFAKETGTCQASVKVNGEHVRGSPFEVQVKPRQFRPVLSFGQRGSSNGKFTGPWWVAVNENNEIAVTEADIHRTQVFNGNGTHLRSFGKKGDQLGDFECPVGIAFHNNNIIVAEFRNHRVQLFNRQGESLGQFGGEGNLDHQLKTPIGLSIDSDGNIIVVDKGNKLVKIFSDDGQILFHIGTEDSFITPFHCIQHDNYLIVSDRGDHCVKVFNREEGTFLYKFGKKGDGDGEFSDPGGLSVNKAGHLMVCDTGNHRIQVFELNGKLVTKFGTKGSKIGEFNRPVSVAVLNDGRVVVSEYLNNRIQVFE